MVIDMTNHEKIMQKLEHFEEVIHRIDKKVAVTEEKTKTIVDRLGKLNGSVAKNVLDIEENRKEISNVDKRVIAIKVRQAGIGGVAGGGVVAMVIGILKYMGLL